jgi:hypothetical protein
MSSQRQSGEALPMLHLFRLARHPRALLDSILTYPRFLGTIKPRLMTANLEKSLQSKAASRRPFGQRAWNVL